MPAKAPLPEPEIIRRTAAEVLQRPAYQLDAPPESGTTIIDLFFKLLRWILAPIRWLFDALEGLPDFLRYAIVIVLVIVLLALIAHILYSLARLFSGLKERELPLPELLQSVRDPDALERQALEAAARGEHVLAVRLLFSAGLVRIEQAHKRKFRAGTTNREVLRRHRDSPVFEPLEVLVGTIESKWFGFEPCGSADYEACRAAYGKIVRATEEASHADGA